MTKRPRDQTRRPTNPSSKARSDPKGIQRTPGEVEKTTLPPPPVAPGWLNQRERRLVEELNARLIEGMLKQADVTHARNWVIDRGLLLGKLSYLNDSTRSRIAKIPIVLLEADFTNGPMWSKAAKGYAITRMEDSLWLDGYDLHVLARSLFTFCWHFTQVHPEGAGIVLGMAEETTTVFANLSLHELERLILQRSHWVRPRWEAEWQRWDNLLDLAEAGDFAGLDQYALQLLYSDLSADLT